ncbi:hypothetical protein GCM10010116_51160 [Microbispora rosea subsp. aerata]|nr:hypothetical protein [Microbispora rosea]GGO25496.1 hypothetical protein GCM10010116_51160 [Microbispora rosea subsp. aerata]GIH58101.1 hypothetical protein Mro02_50150 [Microbispora rosea subsp. aerata]GLJ86220.1 hypothetical protein GCM10017588_49550 [Microbispora rosea subsp. aerata]
MRIVDLLRELRETRALTVVMVSHDLAVVAALCQEAAVLERGRIVSGGTPLRCWAPPGTPTRDG